MECQSVVTQVVCSCIVCEVLEKGLVSYDFTKKKDIIKAGRPKPFLDITFIGKTCNRKFNNKMYSEIDWLTGCSVRSKVFCWPCLLFAKEKNIWNLYGYEDVSNIHKAIKQHNLSECHLTSVLSEKTFGKVRIEHLISEQKKIGDNRHNELVKKNRNILKRYIDAVCYLSKNELAFGGDDESETSLNRGNYVELLYLLKKCDDKLSNFLENASSFCGLSNLIQNDLIESVAFVLRAHIKEEIERAKFVAIVLDETTDVTNLCQLSFMVRYTLNNDIHERFLGFVDLSNARTAETICKIVVDKLQGLKCENKLIAQSYDGAAVMAGKINGLQSRMKERYPHAIFIHCFAHRLNLALSQSVSKISECKGFFMTLNGLAAFFNRSSKRTEALNQERTLKKLPKVSPTRWNYHSRLVETVYECRASLIDVLEKMSDPDNDWDDESYNAASGFFVSLNKFEFCFLLNVFQSFFPFSEALFDIFPAKRSDIGYCTKKTNEFLSFLRENRNNFECIWQEANLQASINENESRRKKFKGNSDIKTFYCQLYSGIYDTIITHLEARFKNVDLLKFLELLNSELFPKFAKNFPDEAFNSLKKTYCTLFDLISLKSQLKVVYMAADFRKMKTVDILKCISSNGLENAYSEVYILCHLVLTFPASTSSVERSFSSLKRIKTHSRNCHSQERLQYLVSLSMEKELLCVLQAKEDFYDNLIDHFAKKPRKLQLNYV